MRIVVRGVLRIGSNVFLRTERIVVVQGGELTVGAESDPALNVTLSLNNRPDCWARANFEGGSCGELVSDGGVLRVYGRPVTSWSYLLSEARIGATQLTVKECANWQPGDRLVLSPTAGAGWANEIPKDPWAKWVALDRTRAQAHPGVATNASTHLVYY